MEKIAQVAKSIQKVLEEEARLAGHVSGFVQRESKLTAGLFVQTLTFGFMANPNATLEELSQIAAALGVKISPQGLDNRFNESAGNFLKKILMLAIKQVITAEAVEVEILRRFAGGIRLYDSTTLLLPIELAEIWEGAGGTNGVNAAMKIDVCLDYSNGQLIGANLMDGRSHEAKGKLHRQKLPANTLRINDLGYYDLAQYEKIADQGAYWLSQIKVHTNIYDKDNHQLNLVKLLKKQCQQQLEVNILLGKTERLPCRLLAKRIPKKIAKQRRSDLLAAARKEGVTASKDRLALADWTIYLTNVPVHLLTLKEAMVLARVRWQIELLFKLWKSHGLVDESRSHKPARILCEVYAKMIALIIKHWLLLISCWQFPDRSLFKAIKTIQYMAFHLACVFASFNLLCQDIANIIRCLAMGGCRVNKRKFNPATHQLLAKPLA